MNYKELSELNMEQLIVELEKCEIAKLETISVYMKAARLDIKYVAASDVEKLVRMVIASKIRC